jgi:hypothetical protein
MINRTRSSKKAKTNRATNAGINDEGELIVPKHGRGKIKPFKTGNAGRPPGTQNKLNSQAKDLLMLAGETAGDALRDGRVLEGVLKQKLTKAQKEAAASLGGGLLGYLTWLALFHPGQFARFLCKILPDRPSANDAFRSVPYSSVAEVQEDLLKQGIHVECELVDRIIGDE